MLYRAQVDPAPATPVKESRSSKSKQGSSKEISSKESSTKQSASKQASPAESRPVSPKQPIQMLADRVLAQPPRAEGERRSRAGILIPATAQVSRRLSWAEAVAVGPHVRTVKPGDKVLFNPEDCSEVEVQGDEYVILRERDIHAVASERMDGGTGLYL